MEDHDHTEVVNQILNPRAENAQKLLAELGLDKIPSREEVHRDIEEKLLLPKTTFPAHWLRHHQV